MSTEGIEQWWLALVREHDWSPYGISAESVLAVARVYDREGGVDVSHLEPRTRRNGEQQDGPLAVKSGLGRRTAQAVRTALKRAGFLAVSRNGRRRVWTRTLPDTDMAQVDMAQVDMAQVEEVEQVDMAQVPQEDGAALRAMLHPRCHDWFDAGWRPCRDEQMESYGLTIHADPGDCPVCIDETVPCYSGGPALRAWRNDHPERAQEILAAKKAIRGLGVQA